MSNTLFERLGETKNSYEKAKLLAEIHINHAEKNNPQELLNVLYSMAVLHYFDYQTIKIILDLSLKRAFEYYHSLRNLSFIKPYEQDDKYLTVHELTRIGILRFHFFKENAHHENLKDIAAKASSYYQSERNYTNNNTAAKTLLNLEIIYHNLIINKDLRDFNTFMKNARDSQESSFARQLGNYVLELCPSSDENHDGWIINKKDISEIKRQIKLLNDVSAIKKLQQDIRMGNRGLRKTILSFDNKVSQDLLKDLDIQITQCQKDNKLYHALTLIEGYLSKVKKAELLDNILYALLNFRKANIYREISNFEAAEYYYEEGESYLLKDETILNKDNKNNQVEEYVWALAGWADVYRQLEQYDLAKEKLNSALKLDTENAWINALLGEIYRLTNHFTDLADENFKYMEKYLKKAIQLKPDYAWALASLGEGYRQWASLDQFSYTHDASELEKLKQDQDDKYKLSEENLKKAIDIAASSDWAKACLGALYRDQNNLKAAIAQYEHILEKDETLSWAFAGLGDLYFRLKNYTEAVKHFNQVLKLDENHAWSLARRGECYRRLALIGNGSDMDKIELAKNALTDLNLAISLDADRIWAYESRAAIYHTNVLSNSIYSGARAIRDLGHAIKKAKNNQLHEIFNYFFYHGIVYLKLDYIDKAQADFKKACELFSFKIERKLETKLDNYLMNLIIYAAKEGIFEYKTLINLVYQFECISIQEEYQYFNLVEENILSFFSDIKTNDILQQKISKIKAIKP